MLPHEKIQTRLQAAVKAVLPEADASTVLVRPCPDPKFGDYQSNALMGLAKERKMNPRQLATDVLKQLDVGEWCEKVDIAGLERRLLSDAVKVMGAGKVKLITVCSVNVAPLHPVQTQARDVPPDQMIPAGTTPKNPVKSRCDD